MRGLGAPEPTLSVVPDVASSGQVVTVFGSGFPAGAVVDFSWNDGLVARDVPIGDLGGFSEVLVILPNTPGGPVDVHVAGQTDLFADVEASMLVTESSSRRSDTAVLGGVLGGVAR